MDDKQPTDFDERIPMMPGFTWVIALIVTYHNFMLGIVLFIICIVALVVGLFVSSDGHEILHDFLFVPKTVSRAIGRSLLMFSKNF